MASDGMFHRGHSQLQLKLRRLQPDLQARVRDWPAGFQFQQTMFLAVQDRGRRFSLFAGLGGAGVGQCYSATPLMNRTNAIVLAVRLVLIYVCLGSTLQIHGSML